MFKQKEFTEPLFKAGFVKNLTNEFDQLSDVELLALFEKAILSSMEDAYSDEALGIAWQKVDRRKVLNELKLLHNKAESDPRQFLNNEYLAPVMDSDTLSRSILNKLHKEVLHRHYDERDFAQYLLRTNVAYSLSPAVFYQPHSHRRRLIELKHSEQGQGWQSMVTYLSQYLERGADYKMRELSKSLSTVMEFNQASKELSFRAPLLLSRILIDCCDPHEIIPNAIRERKRGKAKRLRDELRDLRESIIMGDVFKVTEILKRTQDASKDMTRESPDYAQRVCLCANPNLGKRKSHAETAKRILKEGIEVLWKLWRRRNFAYFLDIEKKTRSSRSLNMLITQVFGIGLTKEELAKFDSLWRVHHS